MTMQVKMSCAKCAKKFETDPRYAQLVMLCPDCSLVVTSDFPPGFEDVFNFKGFNK